MDKTKLRSQEWFGGNDKMGFVHRSWLRNQGYPDDHFRGRPVIGICNTWSELTPCNGHLRDFAEIVKKACWKPVDFPSNFPSPRWAKSYYRRPAPLNDVHGIGAVLLAGIEVLKLQK